MNSWGVPEGEPPVTPGLFNAGLIDQQLRSMTEEEHQRQLQRAFEITSNGGFAPPWLAPAPPPQPSPNAMATAGAEASPAMVFSPSAGGMVPVPPAANAYGGLAGLAGQGPEQYFRNEQAAQGNLNPDTQGGRSIDFLSNPLPIGPFQTNEPSLLPVIAGNALRDVGAPNYVVRPAEMAAGLVSGYGPSAVIRGGIGTLPGLVANSGLYAAGTEGGQQLGAAGVPLVGKDIPFVGNPVGLAAPMLFGLGTAGINGIREGRVASMVEGEKPLTRGDLLNEMRDAGAPVDSMGRKGGPLSLARPGELVDAYNKWKTTQPTPESPAPAEGQAFTVYRGSGRAEQGSAYNPVELGGVSTSEPLFKGATYSAFDPNVAAQFGPNVEQATVTLRNPLVLTNDAEWRALTQQAGWKYPNPTGLPPEQIRADLDRLGEMIKAQGHDGIVVRMDTRGDAARNLGRMFGDDQVVKFNESPAPAPGTPPVGTGGLPPPPSEPAGAGPTSSAPRPPEGVVHLLPEDIDTPTQHFRILANDGKAVPWQDVVSGRAAADDPAVAQWAREYKAWVDSQIDRLGDKAPGWWKRDNYVPRATDEILSDRGPTKGEWITPPYEPNFALHRNAPPSLGETTGVRYMNPEDTAATFQKWIDKQLGVEAPAAPQPPIARLEPTVAAQDAMAQKIFGEPYDRTITYAELSDRGKLAVDGYLSIEAERAAGTTGHSTEYRQTSQNLREQGWVNTTDNVWRSPGTTGTPEFMTLDEQGAMHRAGPEGRPLEVSGYYGPGSERVGGTGGPSGPRPPTAERAGAGGEATPPDTRNFAGRAVDELGGLLGLPQALSTTLDFSALLRQAAVQGVRHPLITLDAALQGIKAAASEGGWQRLDEAVRANPYFERGRAAGLHTYEIGPNVPGTERAGGFTGLNRSTISAIAEKLPGVAQSERGFAGLLNWQGMKVFEKWAGAMEKAAGGELKPSEYKALASVINHARGYGDWTLSPGRGLAPFFSGRNMVSRFQVLLDPLVQPGSLFEPSARQLAATNLATFVAGNMALLALINEVGQLTGTASVEFDPRSTDWGKIHVGNLRIDPWAGFAPIARLIAREVTGETKTSAGNIRGADAQGEVLRFFRNKESPMASFITDVLSGKDWKGTPIVPEGEAGFTSNTSTLRDRFMAKLTPQVAAQMFTPFVIQDTVQAYKTNEGNPYITGLAGVTSFFGAGANSYIPGQSGPTKLLPPLPPAGNQTRPLPPLLPAGGSPSQNQAPATRPLPPLPTVVPGGSRALPPLAPTRTSPNRVGQPALVH